VDGDRAAVELDHARVGGLDARDDLDHRRLAGAVLPDERVHPPGVDGDLRLADRADGAEALRDPAQVQPRRARGVWFWRHALSPSSATVPITW
jgi:hypothetical protein